MSVKDFEILRRQMLAEIAAGTFHVSDLIGKAALDERVMAAMAKVPRHEFVPVELQPYAYANIPLPIGFEKTISQPFIVALMTDLLDIGAEETVLEIGTGLGYQAAILAQLARRVYTVDRYRRLVREAADLFRQLDITNITTITADGSHGLPEQGPFDRILVTAAAEDPPGPLLEQLKPGGIMVLPVGQSDAVQSLIKVTRSSRGFDYEELRPVRFVPLVEGLGSE